MNNAEIIKGIDMTITGLNAIKNALAETTQDVEAPVKKSKSVEKREAIQNEETVATGKFDVEQLNSMKYNEFKKLAASLGVKCTGTREEIMERILALDVTVEKDAVVSEPVEDEQEVIEAKSDRLSSGKRKLAKKADAPAKDEFDEQAEKIATDTPVEDIIEALADVDVKATKKNAVAKLAEALRNGLIEVDDDDEDEDEEDVDVDEDVDDADEDDSDEADEDDSDEADEDDSDEAEDDSEEDEDSDEEDDIEADSYFPEYDPKGYNDPDTMSDERKEAIVTKMGEILTDVSEENLDFNKIEEYIENHATQEEIDLLGEEYDEVEELKLYMELVKRTIDNDGEEHEKEDPYEVGEHDMCCGHELKYVKKTKKYICEVCGAEYEAE